MEIDSYTFGKIVIAGKSFDSDLILYRDTVYSNWWRMNGHVFQIEDIKKYLNKKPKTLIIGTGYSQMMKIDPEAKSYLKKAKIELVVESTSQAWKTFNSMKDRENVMAAFHLTC